MKKFAVLLAALMLLCWTAGALAYDLSEVPANVSDFDAYLPPVSVLDLPRAVSIGQVNGKWAVTFDGDPFALEFKDGGTYGEVELYLSYMSEDDYGTYYYRDEGSGRDGNSFYFNVRIPKNVSYTSAMVGMDIYVDDDWVYSMNSQDNDYRTVEYYSDDVILTLAYTDGVLQQVLHQRLDPDRAFYVMDAMYTFDAATGDLKEYSALVAPDYWVTFDADGKAVYADYFNDEADEYYEWRRETGWTRQDGVTTWEMVPSDAPEGFEDPTYYETR